MRQIHNYQVKLFQNVTADVCACVWVLWWTGHLSKVVPRWLKQPSHESLHNKSDYRNHLKQPRVTGFPSVRKERAKCPHQMTEQSPTVPGLTYTWPTRTQCSKLIITKPKSESHAANVTTNNKAKWQGGDAAAKTLFDLLSPLPPNEWRRQERGTLKGWRERHERLVGKLQRSLRLIHEARKY